MPAEDPLQGRDVAVACLEQELERLVAVAVTVAPALIVPLAHRVPPDGY